MFHILFFFLIKIRIRFFKKKQESPKNVIDLKTNSFFLLHYTGVTINFRIRKITYLFQFGERKLCACLSQTVLASF